MYDSTKHCPTQARCGREIKPLGLITKVVLGNTLGRDRQSERQVFQGQSWWSYVHDPDLRAQGVEGPKVRLPHVKRQTPHGKR